jgi:small-conductance mechanosensitive channel
MQRFIAFVFVFAALSVMAFAAPVSAQTPSAPANGPIDYSLWETEATRAERVIERGDAATLIFEWLRDDLANWRARFLELEGTNQTRVDTIRAQLSALGPAPEGDVVEPPELAARRTDLNQELIAAQTPQRRAVEAYNRAGGLIAEIDTILAQRQAQALLEQSPSPLTPALWVRAWAGATEGVQTSLITLSDRLNAPDFKGPSVVQIGLIALAGLIALVVIFRLYRRANAWAAGLQARGARAGHVAVEYLVSLGQFIVPAIGLALVMLALSQSAVLDADLAQLAGGLVALVLSVFSSTWLAGRLFPSVETRQSIFDIAVEWRAPARRAIVVIGVFMGLSLVAQALAGFRAIPIEARGVFILPVYIGLCFGFWRLAGILKAARNAHPPTDAAPSTFFTKSVWFVSYVLPLIAIVGPILAAMGYLNAAEALIAPTALTLAILGLFLSLQPMIKDIYRVIFKADEDAFSNALLPVLFNFVVLLALLPVIALVWGMRPERLGEFYARAMEGVTFGDTRITPMAILAVILVFSLGLIATRMLQATLKTTVLPRTRMDMGAQNAVASGVGYVGFALAAVIAINSGGIDLTALGFVVGALSVGIGFGLQNVVSNFVSGLILLIERPISEGDWIEVGGYSGIVKSISVRSTRIETFDKTDVIVPNADFVSGTVTNWTRGNTIGRAVVTVSVAYGTDTRRVQDILLEIAKSHPVVATFPAPGVDFMGFGADGLDFRVRAILRDVNQLVSVKTEINHQIAERFAAEGIEIPFAQRDIWLRNPEALAATPPNDAPPNDATLS